MSKNSDNTINEGKNIEELVPGFRIPSGKEEGFTNPFVMQRDKERDKDSMGEPILSDKFGRRLDENDKYVQIDKDSWQHSFFLNVIPEVSQVRLDRVNKLGFDDITVDDLYITDIFKKNKIVIPDDKIDDTIITIYDVPNGVTIVGGIYRGDGVWIVSPYQLGELKILIDDNIDGDLSFKVSVTDYKTGLKIIDSNLTVNVEEVIKNSNQKQATEDELQEQQEQQAKALEKAKEQEANQQEQDSKEEIQEKTGTTEQEEQEQEDQEDTGDNSTSDSTPVYVEPAKVAQAPSLSISDKTGVEDTSIALNILSGLTDSDNGNETLKIEISNVPIGSVLSSGNYLGNGVWSLSAVDLPGLTLTPPSNSSSDFVINIRATSTESSTGSTAVTSGSMNISVDAVADTPNLTVTNNASGNEDSAISLTIGSSLVDNDGSETLAILISGVPTGATLSAGTDNGDNTWTLTSAQLAGLTITPPNNSSTDFTLTITATSTEAEGGDTASLTDTIDVTVNPISDGTTLTANNVSGNEDTAISLDITNTLIDSGETVTSVVLSGIPTGATLSAGTDNGDNTWTLTQAQLAGLTLTPPTDDASEFTVSVTVTTDDNGNTTTTTDTFNVTVNDIADNPNLTLTGTASGNEDTAISLTINAPSLSDTDGSETLSNITISGVPTGASLSAGTDNGDNTWTLTAAQLVGLTITPPTDDASEFTLTVSVTSTEGTGGDTATVTDTIDVTVNDIADNPNLTLTGTASGNEDTAISLTINAPSLSDTDGSETLSNITISGVPTGASLSAGTDNGDNTWTLTSAQLAGLTITPPSNDASEFTLTVSVTATETTGGDTTTVTDTIDVTVNDIADAANVNISNIASKEHRAIDLKLDNQISLADTDGSESITNIVLSGIPSNFKLSAGTDNGNNTWTLTQAQLSNLFLIPPDDAEYNFNITASVTTTEGSGGDTTVSTDTFNVSIFETADAAELSVVDIATKTDTAVDLQISSNITDSDESLSILISGVPTGATLSNGTDNGNNTWTLTKGDLVNLTLTPASADNSDFTLTVQATTTESDGTTNIVTDTINVTVDTTNVPTDADLYYEMSANIVDSGNVTHSSMTLLNNGNYIIVWIDNTNAINEIKAQIRDKDGNDVGSELSLGTPSDSAIDGVKVETLSDNGFALMYQARIGDSNDDIYFQYFDDNGVATGSAVAMYASDSTLEQQDMVALPGGGLAVMGAYANFESYDADGNQVVAPLVIESGKSVGYSRMTLLDNGDVVIGYFNITNSQLSTITINPTTGAVGTIYDLSISSIAERNKNIDLEVLSNGNIVITYTDGVDDNLYFQVRSSDNSTSVLGPTQVTSGSELPHDPVIVTLNDGGFVLFWGQNEASSRGVFGRVYNSDGTARTGIITIDDSSSNANLEVDAMQLDNGNIAFSYSDPSANTIYDVILDPDTLTPAPLYPSDPTINADSLQGNIAAGDDVQLSEMALLSDGNYIIIWTDNDTVDTIYAQVRDADGNNVGAKLDLGTPSDSDILQLKILALSSGGFALSYAARVGDTDDSLYVRMYDNSGSPTSAALEYMTGDSAGREPAAMLELPNGDFAIIAKQAGSDIFFSTYNSSGVQVLAPVNIDAVTNQDFQPSMTVLENGDLAIFYIDADNDILYTNTINSTTGVLGTKVNVGTVTSTTNFIWETATDTLDNGNIAFAYRNASDELVFQIRSSDNSSEVLGETAITTTTASPETVELIALADGRFVVFWDNSAAGQEGVYGRIYNSDGTANTAIITIENSVNNALDFDVAQLPNGNIVLMFTDGTANLIQDIMLSSIDLQPVVIEYTIQNYAGDAAGFEVGALGATDADGGETFTYAIAEGDTDIFEITGGDILSVKAAGVTDYYISDYHTVKISVTDSQGNVFYKNLTVYIDEPTFDTSGKLYGYGSTDDSLVGTSGNDSMYGFSGNDLIVGGDGNDTIYGMQGHDALYGGAGDDTIYGGTGNDSLFGGAGDDNLYGGEGDDELHFSSGEGNDIAYGGQGTDTVMLHDLTGGPGVVAGAGTWSLTTGDSYTTNGDVITFDNPDASGTITYWDGSTLTFFGVEKINWDATAGSNTLTANNISGNEDTAIALDVSNILTDNDGSEAITNVIISGVPTGATLSAGTDNGDNTWTLTGTQLAGVTITPATNDDTDFTLTVTVTNTELATGATNTTTDTMDVTVTAVADSPNLSLTGTASGNEDTAISLTINAPSLVDSDGSETLSNITISGVPTGAVLSAGTDNGDNTWTLTSAQLAGLTITPPSNDASEFTLTVSVTSTETTGGDTAT